MTASLADIGYGTKVYRNSVLIDEVVECTAPQPEVGEVEVTHLNSDNQAKEFKPGLKDFGEASFVVNWLDAAGHDQILSDFDASTIAEWKYEYSNGKTETFNAYVKGMEKSIAVEDPVRMTVTLRCSGASTIT
jgi:hypothetical protein